MSYDQLDTLRKLFSQVEAERERIRSRSLMWRFRKATEALLRTHGELWHRRGDAGDAKRATGERVRALCALLVRSGDDPMVMKALAAQLRDAIEEYVRRANQPGVLNFPMPDAARDAQSPFPPAA